MACRFCARQAGDQVDVLDALVGVLDVEVERLAVEDHGGGVLVLVGPPADLDHRLHVGDDELGVLVGHHVGAGDDGRAVGHLHGPVRVPRQVLDRLELAGRLLQVLEHLALGVDGVDDAALQGLLQRPEGQVVLVIPAQPQLRRVVHVDLEHLGLVVPVVGIRELDDLDVVHGHAVHPQHQLDAGVFLDAPPVVLDRVQALRQPDLLALEVGRCGRCRRGRAPSSPPPSYTSVAPRSRVRRMSALTWIGG